MPPAFPPSVVPCLGLVSACGLLWSSSASAQLQTYSFEAIIQSTESSSAAFADRNLGLVAGSTITGTFVIDLSAQDTLGDLLSFGSYRNYAPGSVSEYNPQTGTNNALPRISFSSLTLELPKGTIAFGEVSNDYGPKTFDTYEEGRAPRINVSNGETYTTESGKLGTASGDSLNFYQKLQIASSAGPGSRARTVDFLLNDSTGNAFNSDGLPASLSLEQFDNASIFFNINENPMTIQYPGSDAIRGNASFVAQITCVTAVPEPSALALCSLAGGLLFIRRRR
ncbi:MAG: PEP-CTERM sorting domain-containing protein [Verrucomicrobiaceae bacterium]|nr:MAG: PEP-CTERM sorting domain-containing protein [Verrucomicrobiaceae bacterium]